MVMLYSQRQAPIPALARWLLGLGIAATLAANAVHGLGHSLTGPTEPAWPAVALVGWYEFLMMVTRNSQVPAHGTLETEHDADPLREEASPWFPEAGGRRGTSAYQIAACPAKSCW